jgi:hypothetical protein
VSLPPPVARAGRSRLGRWAGFLLLSWLILRPALLVTISLDDFINPFSVFHDYGSSPFGMLPEVNRDVLRNGHFNFFGQSIGAVVFRIYAHLMSWGVRYSFLYAMTKFAVFVLVAVLAARVLRALAELAGRTIGLWRSRVIVALVLFTTLQLHVAWSLDPVGSFPLSGYLSVVVGLWAFDVGFRALAARSVRSLAGAATAMCLAVLYYEINVAMIAALAPVVVVRLRRARARDVLLRAGAIVAPAAAMTLVLQAVAAASNRGYTGTDVGVGENTPTVVVRTVAGSLPGSAWPVARDWLGRPFAMSVAAALCLVPVVVTVVVAAMRRQDAGDPTDRGALALVVASPVVMWLAATLVQATTQKVRVETIRVGYVYNYYAYGSVGVVLAALLAVPLLPRRDLLRRARPVLVAAAIVFVVAQSVVNDDVHRKFGADLRANRDLLASFTDEPPPEQRCSTLEAWASLPYWQAYYREALVDGINTTYAHFHDEPFCAGVGAAAAG